MRREDLTIAEKLIFGKISRIATKHGEFYAVNKYLSKELGYSTKTVSRAINKLIELGDLEVVCYDGNNRVLKVPTPSKQNTTTPEVNHAPKADQPWKKSTNLNEPKVQEKEIAQEVISPLSNPINPDESSFSGCDIVQQSELRCQVDNILEHLGPTPRERGTNQRAQGTNPREQKTNPRELKKELKNTLEKQVKTELSVPQKTAWEVGSKFQLSWTKCPTYIRSITTDFTSDIPPTPFFEKGASVNEKIGLEKQTHTEQVSKPQGTRSSATPRPKANKANIDPSVPVRNRLVEFDRLWEAYPKHMRLKQALKAFLRMGLTADEVEAIIARIRQITTFGRWYGADPQFVPNLSNFLNERLWEDDSYTIPRRHSGGKKPYVRNEFSSFKIEDLDFDQPEHFRSFRVEDL
jgi:hypothetical protein